MQAQTQLWPFAVYLAATVLLVVSMLGLSAILGQRHRERTTDEPFESGMPPTGSAHGRFPVSFYVMAVIFLIFDMETVLFVSWAIALRQAGWTGFVEILFVSVVLLAALLFLWRAGVLDWGPTTVRAERPQPHRKETP